MLLWALVQGEGGLKYLKEEKKKIPFTADRVVAFVGHRRLVLQGSRMGLRIHGYVDPFWPLPLEEQECHSGKVICCSLWAAALITVEPGLWDEKGGIHSFILPSLQHCMG
ncbi:unnamed protein product [Natator depressus]